MTIYGQTTEVDRPKHPSSSWANWKQWKFMYWDKDIPSPTPEDPDHMGAEVEIKLPKEFVVVAECWCVKWYLENKGWIWSNEVDNCSRDILTIRTNSGEILYEWAWNDIKDKVKAVGLKLSKNVHYVDPKKPNELKTFCLRGAGLKEWFNNFSKESRNVPWNNTLTLKEIKEGKTWANKYTYPSFGVVSPLTDKERVLQQEWGAKLVVYRNATNVTPEELEEEAIINESKYDDDDLPF